MQNRRGLMNDKLRTVGNTRSNARGEKLLASEFNLLLFFYYMGVTEGRRGILVCIHGSGSQMIAF